METNTRCETGPVKFNNDWTGLFLRGDCCFAYAQALRIYLDPTQDGDTRLFARIQLESLMRLLGSTNENTHADEETVTCLKPFSECVSSSEQATGIEPV